MPATNTATGAVQPATIGFTASPVMVGITVSIITQVLSLFFPRLALTDVDAKFWTEIALSGISLASAGWAWIARKRSALQPVKLGGPSANTIP